MDCYGNVKKKRMMKLYLPMKISKIIQLNEEEKQDAENCVQCAAILIKRREQ